MSARSERPTGDVITVPSASKAMTSGLDDVGRGDQVVDGVYRALPDPVSDGLLSLVTALAAEVWTTRDRLRLVEAALAKAGVDLDVDALRDSPEQIEALRADRDAFVERVYAVVATPGPRP